MKPVTDRTFHGLTTNERNFQSSSLPSSSAQMISDQLRSAAPCLGSLRVLREQSKYIYRPEPTDNDFGFFCDEGGGYIDDSYLDSSTYPCSGSSTKFKNGATLHVDAAAANLVLSTNLNDGSCRKNSSSSKKLVGCRDQCNLDGTSRCDSHLTEENQEAPVRNEPASCNVSGAPCV